MNEKDLVKLIKELLEAGRHLDSKLKTLKIEWVLLDECVKPNVIIEYE